MNIFAASRSCMVWPGLRMWRLAEEHQRHIGLLHDHIGEQSGHDLFASGIHQAIAR